MLFRSFTRLVILSEIYTAGHHRQALQVDPKFQNKLAETIIVTSSDDPASFEIGSDLLRADGLQWSRPLYVLSMKN